MRDLSSPARQDAAARAQRTRQIPRPQIGASIIRKEPPKTPVVKKPEKAAEPAAQKPIQRLPAEMLKQGGPISPQDLLKTVLTPPGTPPATEVEEEDADGQRGKARPGQVTGRDDRHRKRSQRAEQRKGRETEVVHKVAGGGVEVEERPLRVKRGGGRLPKMKKGPTQPRKGKVPIQMPITVRSLSEAVGIRSGDILMRLWNHGAPQTININSTVEPDMAETIALEFGCELEIKRPVDLESDLLAPATPESPEDLVPRAPIVTIMGHVDHGKTSLLDKIRSSNVVATEAGGITQVIRAWRVEHGGRPVTFLDTPGHEAFTKMRARGAQVTDIVVIVVAADDGVMPQTEEAINHAKAAGVPIVVAINKVDLPNANINRTRQQLYGQGLIPDTMGGDTPFVETSAATGKGIDELLDMLALVAELKELTANPNKPAAGTCLEAMLSEGEGVLATLLVQEGTLHKGDVILCGSTSGRVRAMYDDAGRPIDEAGPSVPVRITGLDEVPNADDPFRAVNDFALAREIAERRKVRQQEAAQTKRSPVKLETLTEAKITELKVILKADFRGSIEAIRKELEKFQHDEVRVRVLHTGIGAITESDVQLALTSPEDTIIVGFNVVPDDRARSLAEERGVQIREYDIIYNLTDDIKAALQGKLKPKEEVIHLGRAVVRETFKISRVGTIAGCYVTQGTIERSAKIRLIREGVVIYPPPDKTAGLESLKRFKEDVREVREGFECGLKIAGYDDVKVGDVIEAYRVEQVQRTL
jgi:translation initiation factor IF-2